MRESLFQSGPPQGRGMKPRKQGKGKAEGGSGWQTLRRIVPAKIMHVHTHVFLDTSIYTPVLLELPSGSPLPRFKHATLSSQRLHHLLRLPKKLLRGGPQPGTDLTAGVLEQGGAKPGRGGARKGSPSLDHSPGPTPLLLALGCQGVLLPPSQIVLFFAAFLEESHLTSAAFPFPFRFPLPTLQITAFLKIAGVSSSMSPTARLVV